MNKPGADWLAWILNAVFGLCAGAFLAMFLVEGKVFQNSRGVIARIPLITKDWAVWFPAGVGLVSAGFASLRGEHFWSPGNWLDLPPRHSRLSVFLSKTMIFAGGTLSLSMTALSFPGFGLRLSNFFHEIFFFLQ